MSMSQADGTIWAALIAAGTSVLVSIFTLFAAVINTPLKYWLQKKSLRDRLAVEYEYKQRNKVRNLISRYRGLLVETADILSKRFWNLYENESAGWLNVSGDYSSELNYYFRSSVLRFLTLMSNAHAFEKEVLFIDERVAEKEDFDFLHLVKAWSWVLCDVQLFKGIVYDHNHAKDHFFHDSLRRVCSACFVDGKQLSSEDLGSLLGCDSRFDQVCRYFDGLCRQEQRLRWDRLVCLHLLVMLFLNEFGYASQKSTKSEFKKVASYVGNSRVLENLAEWMPTLAIAHTADEKRLLNLISVSSRDIPKTR